MNRENYNKLIEKIEREFSIFEKPKLLCGPQITKSGKVDFEISQIQKDFGSLKREEMNYNQCAMMLVDEALLTDEAFLYFLPRLVKAVFEEKGNEFFLYVRLERIDRSSLNESQKSLLGKLFGSLKELEKERETDEGWVLK